MCGHDWQNEISRVPLAEDPFGSSCMQKARVWLQDCIHGYSECKSEPSPLPTRVVDVGSGLLGATPHLYVSKGETLPYATLSYRWGSNMRCQTTKENFTRFQEAIHPDEMPLMFRDAITITRQLGIRYLWIDALCIIQGDDDDWNREAGSMASVYGSSTLTLSALSSASPSEGLSPRRFQRTFEQVDLNGIYHVVHIREEIPHD